MGLTAAASSGTAPSATGEAEPLEEDEAEGAGAGAEGGEDAGDGDAEAGGVGTDFALSYWRTNSSGVGVSAICARRIKIISAAARVLKAVCVSSWPFNKTCHARDSTRVDSISAAERPRARALRKAHIFISTGNIFQPRDPMRQLGKIGNDDGRVRAKFILCLKLGQCFW